MAPVSADVDRLQRRLASDGRWMKLPSNIVADLSRVRRALYRLQGVLTTAEKQPFDASKEPLLRKIKQSVYYVEDILDELEDGSIKSQRSSRARKLAGASDIMSQVIFSFSWNHSVLHCRTVSEMKKIRKKLDRASDDSSILSLLHYRADGEQSFYQDVFDETAIIGRDNDKENLRALLLGNSQERFSIIPIVGLGGLGKTALAQLIFNDQDKRYNFDLRIWINLNMSYDLISIARTIISEANKTEEGTSQVSEECQDNPQITMNRLREILHDKICLIVLDGLWSTDEGQLLHLKKMLRDTQMGTKIIVTTCSENVAKLVHTVEPYKLGPLSEENCWTIFSQKVRDDGGNADLTRVRKQMVNICEGIPALVHSLSSLVCDKGTSVWNDETQELWKLERQLPLQISIFSSIKQIYHNMSSPMKSCISYLSMFPKGFDIRLENLIRQWDVLGILGSAHGTMPIYSQGKKYIQDLFSVFFLEAPDKSSVTGLNQATALKVLKVHNLVHEFARYVTSHDLFILDGDSACNDSTGNSTYRYALLTRCNEQSKIRKFVLTSVRAICLKNCGGAKLIEKLFSVLKWLRVLDLSRCSIRELPSSICQLTHLRYIDISSSAIQSLPDQMRFLQNLEALDLSETCIQVLPDFVGTFHKLKYLNVQGCRELHHFISKLENIKSLQHLNLSCCPAAHQLLESISGFQELRFLDVSGCTELQALPDSFGRLTNLEDLILSNCSRLKKIPESFGELCFLQFLNLSSCCQLEHVPASLGKLVNLVVLILSGCSRIQNLPHSFSEIAFLRMLDLAGCVDLHLNFAMLPNSNLENLNVDGCRKIYAMPGWAINFPKLHPECLKTCEQQIRCITDKKVCPSHDELEISNELNVYVRDETGEAMASQSWQQGCYSECSTKKVINDSSGSGEIPQQHTTPTGVQRKSGRSLLVPSSIRLSKMSSCFMYGINMKQNIEGGTNMKIFSYHEVRKATNNFDLANKIGEGSFGPVYKGKLKDGRIVAVRVLSAISRQGAKEFRAELGAISAIVHENLVTLVGCCAELSHRILIYSYFENNSLAHKLLGLGSSKIQFRWRDRAKIAVGVARGLSFLHDEIRPPIVHRNIKASNILLDKDLTPKISDFGLAMLLPPNATHVATRVAGNLAYLAPEYAIRGQVTKKSDVYSFGVLLLEIVSGRSNHDFELRQDHSLLEKTWTYYEQGKLEQIIDEGVGDDLDVEEACRFLKVGLLCTQDSMKLRPTMVNVVNMLMGEEHVTMDKVMNTTRKRSSKGMFIDPLL